MFAFFYTAPLPASSPTKAPPYHPSASSSPSTSSKGRHSSLILILGIGAGVLFIAIISLLVVCLCMSRQEKTKAPPMETGKCGIYLFSSCHSSAKANFKFYVQIA